MVDIGIDARYICQKSAFDDEVECWSVIEEEGTFD